MSKPGVNPNITQIAHPVADVGALRNVCEQLKQGVDSLAGFRGGALDRAVTFQDLIGMGLIDASIATSPDGSSRVDGAQYHPADPTGTASTGGVMMGLKAAYAPRRTGAVFVAVSGTIENDTAGQTTTVQLVVGAGGAPPSNGGAVAGEAAAIGQAHKADAISSPKGFCSQAIVFGLSLNSDYWFDLILFVSGGTGSIKKLSVSIVEL